MPRENHVAKQRRIGERLSRAMVKAHMDRQGTGRPDWLRRDADPELGTRARGALPEELIKLCHALDVRAGVAVVLGAPTPLISGASPCRPP